jgi:hypothetical protein
MYQAHSPANSVAATQLELAVSAASCGHLARASPELAALRVLAPAVARGRQMMWPLQVLIAGASFELDGPVEGPVDPLLH